MDCGIGHDGAEVMPRHCAHEGFATPECVCGIAAQGVISCQFDTDCDSMDCGHDGTEDMPRHCAHEGFATPECVCGSAAPAGLPCPAYCVPNFVNDGGCCALDDVHIPEECNVAVCHVDAEPACTKAKTENPNLCVVSDIASENDDPHMTNMFGTHFDINFDGLVPLLNFHHGTEAPKLMVEGRSERLINPDAKHCGGTGYYITEIRVSGAWLGSHKRLALKKDGSTKGQFMLDLDGRKVELPQASKDGNADERMMMNEVQKFNVTFSSSPTTQRMTTIHFLSGVKLRIEARTQDDTEETTGFLNLEASGLKRFAKEAGGILGYDDPAPYINHQAIQDCMRKTGQIGFHTSTFPKSQFANSWYAKALA